MLLSDTTAALVGDELPAGVSLLDLGRHVLKDIRRPERISQLQIEGLRSDFQPSRAWKSWAKRTCRPRQAAPLQRTTLL